MFKEITPKKTIVHMLKRQQTHKFETDFEDFTQKVLLEDERTRVKSRESSANARKELKAVGKTLAKSQFHRLREDDGTSEGSDYGPADDESFSNSNCTINTVDPLDDKSDQK